MTEDATVDAGLQGLLGYLNFSTGRPDPRAQAQLFAAWNADSGDDAPWSAVHRRLLAALAELQRAGNAAFQDAHQAQAVLDLTFAELLPAYQQHHADLLFHQTAAGLFQPGFVIRAVEAVLAQQGPWDERERIVTGALKQLNDYVGHRPVAVLESREGGEPYAHEKLRPIPLYLRGAGVAPGGYAALVTLAVERLRATSDALKSEAYFELDRLDELAFDPRSYDHNHPADRRPNYRFGEWDPHHIDNQGYYRRLVVRQLVLDGLLERIQQAAPEARPELLQEASAVLAATVLMASGITGAGPETHDSSVNLATLMPRIARYRDTFYNAQLQTFSAGHADRLQSEAKQTRQPFGGARQHLNHFLAQQRAAQLQQRHLAMILAALGYPEAARRHAARVPAVSLRLLTDIHLALTNGRILAEHGQLADAADELAKAEDVLHRAIDCGAVVDPWNVLGFQGLYPLFTATEDSIHDHRIDELVQVIDRALTLYAHLRGEAAAHGDKALGDRLRAEMDNLAAWWDRFATTTVNDIRHVQGREASASAEQVAKALGHWRERGEAGGDVAFWKQHLADFRSDKSFALVVDALLLKQEFRPAMALLMSWLGQTEDMPVEEGEYSFHVLALRWMLGIGHHSVELPAATVHELVRKFMDYLEANADAYWHVPRLERLDAGGELLPMPTEDDEEEEALFGAAYEGVTFEDSADDGNEGELLGFEPRQAFELEQEGERLEKRLRFLSTVSRLFHLGSRNLAHGPGRAAKGDLREVIQGWLARAQRNYQDLLTLMDAIHDHAVPAPSGSYDSLVEYDRRHVIKQRLLTVVLGTCLETALAVGSMRGVVRQTADDPPVEGKRPRWEPSLLRIEQALWLGDSGTVRKALPRFLESFQHEPLLFAPLQQGGHPRLILRSSIAQTLLRALVANLPRLGLLRETYSMLRVAQTMEREQKLKGPRVTEFNRLFQIACQASVEAVAVATLDAKAQLSDAERIGLLGRLIEPYLGLWKEHSQTLRLSVLETVADEADWDKLRTFIKRYGNGLFHARFMTLANLRGILQRGVGAYLRYLADNPDPQNPVSLIDDLDVEIPRDQAEAHLQTVLHAAIENYEEYKDYNTTTPQSDYGENLHVLLDFLRLKAAYDRQAWQIGPLLQVHEVLVKHSTTVAALWQKQIEQLTTEAASQYLKQLAELERTHGLRLRTIGDRVRERFVQPLGLDRVCALVEPAYEEARAGQPGLTLARLEEGLRPFLDAPSGSGLDVPFWLRRLESEVQRVQVRHTAIANLAENLMQVPRVHVPVEQLRDQLQDWPRP